MNLNSYPINYQDNIYFTARNKNNFLNSDSSKSFADKLYEEEKSLYLHQYPKNTKDIISKFYDIPEYNIYDLPNLSDKKKDDLEYLYSIASKRDVLGDLRVPPESLSYYAKCSTEHIKSIENIVMSKNVFGGWSFEPNIINIADNCTEKQIRHISSLLNNKVNPYNLLDIINLPEPTIEKIIEKSMNLNILYGNKLQEVEFGINKNNEPYLSADITIPHPNPTPENPNRTSFKRLFTLLDNNLNPMLSKPNPRLDIIVDDIYKNIENKLFVFDDKKLDDAISNIKNDIPEIKNVEILSVMQRLTQFANYTSLQDLSQKLIAENVGKISDETPLDKLFNYFADSKQLFPLAQNRDSKNVCFVTKNSIDDLNVILPNSHVYVNLEGWDDGINIFSDETKLESVTKKVIKKAMKIQKNNPDVSFNEAVSKVLNTKIEKVARDKGIDVKTIRIQGSPTKETILKQMQPIMPTKGLIKSTIETIASSQTKNRKEYNDLCEDIANYYKNNLNAFSKQGVIENLKKLNEQINNYVEINQLSKDNVYYVLEKYPAKVGSFELISKMFNDALDIPKEQVLELSSIRRINDYPQKSTFVILDDILGSGDSMMKRLDYMFLANGLDKDKHVVFAPIMANKDGIDYINDFINVVNRKDVDTVITSNIANDKTDTSAINANFQKLIGNKGHKEQCMCTVFPYMAPDNNSALSSYIVKHFVPDYHCIKTKAEKLPEMEKKFYYYNVFGTDNEKLFPDYKRVYSPQKENVLLTNLRKLFNLNK